jgi:DNA-binding transcriptional regulator LsrR (DeoR family)
LKAQKKDIEFQIGLSCFAAAELGMNQEAIANFLKVSQAQVSRLLLKAEQDGWIKWKPQLNLPANLRQTVYAQYQDDEIVNHFGKSKINEILVVPDSPEEYDPNKEWDSKRRVMERVNRAGAYFILNFLKGQKKEKILLGWTWGECLRDVAIKICDSITPDQGFNSFAVPLFGDFLFDPFTTHNMLSSDLAYSASGICAYLNDYLFQSKGESARPNIYFASPSYIPYPFLKTKQEEQVIRSFIESSPAYRLIYGDRGANNLISQVDMIITGLSCIDLTEKTWLLQSNFINTEELSELRHRAVGDISGYFINFPYHDDNVLNDINNRIFGPKPCDFLAAKKRNAIVLGIVSHPKKAKVVASALESGCFSHMIISKSLANEIKKLIDSKQPDGQARRGKAGRRKAQ